MSTNETPWLTTKGEHCLVSVKVIPSAKKNEIVGLFGNEAVKIRIQAPPVDGKANQKLSEFLAKVLSLKSSEVVLLRGALSTYKCFEISAPASEIKSRLGGFLSC